MLGYDSRGWSINSDINRNINQKHLFPFIWLVNVPCVSFEAFTVFLYTFVIKSKRISKMFLMTIRSPIWNQNIL